MSLSTTHRPPFLFFCQSEELLLQFLLKEFFSIYGTIKDLKNECLTAFNSVAVELQIHSYANAQQYLSNLTCHSLQRMIPQPLNQTSGSLDRLYHFCLNLKGSQKRSRIATQITSSFTFTYALEEIISSNKIKNGQMTSKLMSKALFLCNKLENSIDKIKAVLTTMLKPSQDHEHLLCFLLRHRIQLDKSFGQNFFAEFIQNTFPNHFDGLQNYLQRKFLARNFDRYLPNINALIEDALACHK